MRAILIVLFTALILFVHITRCRVHMNRVPYLFNGYTVKLTAFIIR